MPHPLKVKLLARGKTRTELAKFLGVSKQAISYWLSGESQIHPRHVPKIAEFLGEEPEALATALEAHSVADAAA